jgi:2-polyprenyl-6-hydroxyphenyl methylase/3-demethylubiquinone-9 3-methyltransferase
MTAQNLHTGYEFKSAEPTWASQYLWAPMLETVRARLPNGGRIFEVGCGNGAAARMLADLGYEVTGIDPSEGGIALAKRESPKARLEVGSAYDDLAAAYGRFPVVISLEVVEHCFWPRQFARSVFDLLEPGGTAIISTPYHGYIKNLMLALFDKFDSHWGPLWDGGHIKFWSERTLGALLAETGFTDVRFVRAGRFGPIAKSMIAIARKPAAG